MIDNGKPSDPVARLGDVVVAPHLERRGLAAACDAAVVGLSCVGLFLAYDPFGGARRPWLGWPAAGVLGLYAAAEMIAGVTPGKWLAGLAVRRPDGARPGLPARVARGAVRLLPGFVFAGSLLARDAAVFTAIAGLSVVIGLFYVPACYFLLARQGRTLFDAAAGTVVVRAGHVGPSGANR